MAYFPIYKILIKYYPDNEPIQEKSPLITSYLIKQLVLKQVEEVPLASEWQNNEIIKRLISMVIALKDGLPSRECPSSYTYECFLHNDYCKRMSMTVEDILPELDELIGGMKFTVIKSS